MVSVAISGALFDKADPAMREELSRDAAGSRELPVMFVLACPSVVDPVTPGTAQERAEIWSQRFGKATADFTAALERVKAQRIEHYWIASAVSARVRREALDELAARD